MVEVDRSLKSKNGSQIRIQRVGFTLNDLFDEIFFGKSAYWGGGGGFNKFILIKIFFRTISSKYCCFGQELYVTSKIPTEAPVGTTLQTILRF